MGMELTEERKKELAQKEAELQARANTCLQEVREVFKKHKCHMLIKATFSSDGKMLFTLDAETNLEPI